MIINVIENRYSYESEFWCKDTKKIASCQEFEGSILGSILGSLSKEAYSKGKGALRKVYTMLQPTSNKPYINS